MDTAAPLTVAAAPTDASDFAIVDLPAVRDAATVVHKGSMDDVMPSYEAVARWIEANGYRATGYAREFHIEAAPDECEAWVTELQQPVVPA